MVSPTLRPGREGVNRSAGRVGAILGPVPPTRPTPQPLWAQILDDLRERLRAGEFGERFPGDHELVAHYGVSRHTVREAVRRLQAEGVLERTRGRGTVVTGRPIEQPVGALYSLFRSVEEQGLAQLSVVRHLGRRRDEEAAAVLGLEPGTELVYLERVRLADGDPIALDCSWLPAAVASPLLEVDFTHTALYKQLADRCGGGPTSGWERIRPCLPDRAQRAILGMGPRDPAFAVERLAGRGDELLEWRHSVIRGDRFAFVARWSEGQLGANFETDATARPGDPDRR
jgi:GntR family transcriptional regulator